MSVLLPECIIRIISGFHGVGFEEVSSVPLFRGSCPQTREPEERLKTRVYGVKVF